MLKMSIGSMFVLDAGYLPRKLFRSIQFDITSFSLICQWIDTFNDTVSSVGIWCGVTYD
jgi:hypothetical protein